MFARTVEKWWADNAMRLSASLSYYTVFSLAPLLIVATAVAGLLFSEEAVQQELLGQVQALIGPEGAVAVHGLLERAREPRSGVIMTAISVGAIIVLSTGVFAELQDALNTIWRIHMPQRGWFSVVKDRLFSFMLVIGIGFLLVVSLLLSAGLSAAGKFFGSLLPVPEVVMQMANDVFSFMIFTLLFAMMYKILPDAHIRWRDVWMGAFVTAGLFTAGKSLIGLYLGKTGVASAYGAASSLAIILLWVYYSALIFFLGAEFTYVYAAEYGSRIGIDESQAAMTRQAEMSAAERNGSSILDTVLYWTCAAFVLRQSVKRVARASRAGPPTIASPPLDR
jgi:membrane protein